MEKKLLGIKVFSINEHKKFLKSSLDFNPAHRLDSKFHQFNSNKTVIHGINVLLTSLELFLKLKKRKPKTLRCFFLKPIHLNEKISFLLYFEKNKEICVEAKNEKNITCSKIIISYKFDKIKNKLSEKNVKLIKFSKKKISSNPIKYLKKKFKLNFKKKIDKGYFPIIKKNFGVNFCNSMFTTSYFIGMQCPGKNALFTNINLNLSKLNILKKYLIFYVNNYDSRIKLFTINTNGFIESNIKSFNKN